MIRNFRKYHDQNGLKFMGLLGPEHGQEGDEDLFFQNFRGRRRDFLRQKKWSEELFCGRLFPNTFFENPTAQVPGRF